MKRINFALLSDAVFFTVCAFFISFTLLRYFFKSVITALVISALFSLAVCSASLFILLLKRHKFIATAAGKRDIKALSLYLSLCGGRQVAKLFLPAIKNARLCGNHVEDEKRYFRFIFKLSPVTCDDIAAFIRLKTGKEKVLLCAELSAEAKVLCENFFIKAIQIDEVYLLLSEHEALPCDMRKYEEKKANALKKIGARLNKKTYLSLLFCGAFLCAYSFFTFYPLYYIVSGCILCTLSAALYFIKRFKAEYA